MPKIKYIAIIVLILALAVILVYKSNPFSQKSFVINASDNEAGMNIINAKKGDTISITFNVGKDNVYYGGLTFRGNTVDTGTILPGQSKTITFRAEESFDLIPYWPASNIVKPYKISVSVR